MPTYQEAKIICQNATGTSSGPAFELCVFNLITGASSYNPSRIPNYGVLNPLLVSKYGGNIPFFDLSFDINDFYKFDLAMTAFWTLKGGFYTASLDITFPRKYLFSHPKSNVRTLIFSSNLPVNSDNSIKYFASFNDYFDFVNAL